LSMGLLSPFVGLGSLPNALRIVISIMGTINVIILKGFSEKNLQENVRCKLMSFFIK